MRKITWYFYVIFLSCAATVYAVDRPGIAPSGNEGKPASSGLTAPQSTLKEGKKEIQEQSKDIIIVTPGDSPEGQELRENKEINLKLEHREFMGIEPHHFNDSDSTIIRQRPDRVK